MKDINTSAEELAIKLFQTPCYGECDDIENLGESIKLIEADRAATLRAAADRYCISICDKVAEPCKKRPCKQRRAILSPLE